MTVTPPLQALEWRCSTCNEPQVAVWGATVPADLRCLSCESKERDFRERLAESMIPAGYRGYTRRSWECHFGRSWPLEDDLEAPPAVVYLYGPTGTGKTSAAAVLLAEHIRTGGRGLWADKGTIEDVIRESREGGAEISRRLARAELLVWDEPLGGLISALAADKVLATLNTRTAELRRTVVTGQLAPTDLMPGQGRPPVIPALASRLLSGEIVLVDGLDARLGGASS